MKTQIANVTKIAFTSHLNRVASLAALLLMLCFASGAWAQAPVVVTNAYTYPVPIYLPQNNSQFPLYVGNTATTPLYVTSTGRHQPFSLFFNSGQEATYSLTSNQQAVITSVTVGGLNAGPWLVDTQIVFPGSNTANQFLYAETKFPSGVSLGAATFSSKLFLGPKGTVLVSFYNGTTMYVVPSGMNVSINGYYEPVGNDDF